MPNPLEVAAGSDIYLFSLFDPQLKNQFEIIITPYDPTSIFSSIESASLALYDNIISKFFIQGITIPFPSFRYEAINETKKIKGIEHPESVSITFLEHQTALVRNYLDTWSQAIAEPTYSKGLVGMLGNKGKPTAYYFKPNQIGAKKTAIVIPQSNQKLPIGGFMILVGLNLQSIGDITLAHEDGDPMRIEATFSVDSVYFTNTKI